MADIHPQRAAERQIIGSDQHFAAIGAAQNAWAQVGSQRPGNNTERERPVSLPLLTINDGTTAADLKELTRLSLEKQQREKIEGPPGDAVKANQTILNIPNTVRAAAAKGQESVGIMQVGGQVIGWGSDVSTPKLNPAEQTVFNALQAQGLNPTLKHEMYSRGLGNPSTHEWTITANWGAAQGSPELRKLTELGKARHDAEMTQFKREQAEREMQQAEALIARLPAMTKAAASRGVDSLTVMTISAPSQKHDAPAPPLSPAQQKVFEALKAMA